MRAVSRFVRVAGLAGIAQAAASARDGIDVVLRQPDVRRRADRIATAAAREGAAASATLEGGTAEPGDPVWQGALRVTGAVAELAPVWSRAPLQVLARLQVLAAADLVAGSDLGSGSGSGLGLGRGSGLGSEAVSWSVSQSASRSALGSASRSALGRPVDADAARRLQEMTAELAATRGGAAVPALVVAALVHATVAESFAPAGGLVGRAAERVVLMSTGLDPHNLLVPEAGHLAAAESYAADRAACVTGRLAGPARWAERCCRAYTYAAERTALLAAEAGVVSG